MNLIDWLICLDLDMAQDVLPVPRVQHDTQHEDVQRFQQVALLRSVSCFHLLLLLFLLFFLPDCSYHISDWYWGSEKLTVPADEIRRQCHDRWAFNRLEWWNGDLKLGKPIEFVFVLFIYFFLLLFFWKLWRHIPKAKATTVTETPEMRRLAENTKLQSQVNSNSSFYFLFILLYLHK